MSRNKGFNAILKECASFSLAEEIIYALHSISSFKQGYYHYYFTTIQNGNFEKTHVTYAKNGSSYRFIINSQFGFTITPKNVTYNFGKLIDNIPILTLYQYAKANFEGTFIPVNVIDFIGALHEYYGSDMIADNCKLNILFGGDDFNLRFDYEDDAENIYYFIDDKGHTMYLSTMEKTEGSCKIVDNYNMSMFQVMLSMYHFFVQSRFLNDDILHLAPNGVSKFIA